MNNINNIAVDSRVISSADDIDLSRHGIIEAHAGTGKTYTIVKLVLRMLEQPSGVDGGFIHLRDILLVTFTEKAAGELKKRIQEGIAPLIKELRGGTDNGGKNEKLAAHLENCLNNMHEALIGTIHSVCLRLLQTWPFETGVHFNINLADDGEGADTVLRESMRTDWQDESTGLPRALRALERLGWKLGNGHRTLIAKTALEFMNGDGGEIDESLRGDIPMEGLIDGIEGVSAEIQRAEEKLAPLLKHYCNLLAGLYASGRLKEQQHTVIRGVMSSVDAMLNSGVYDTKRLADPTKSSGCGNAKIYTKADVGKIPEFAPAVEEAVERISKHPYLSLREELSTLQLKLVYALICRAAEILAERYGAYKRENGLVSYNDMLRLMRGAVYSPESVMLARLRRQLRFGIIDEFQDTSAVQWDVFRKIFLDDCAPNVEHANQQENHGAKIYVVGDPKQSIYSFQNADIQSYIDAKKTIAGHGGAVYCLVDNYRSLPEMIDGYNAILSRKDTVEHGADWFLFDGGSGISYPSAGGGGERARPPERGEAPPRRPAHKAVQVVNEDGQSMAAAACAAIKKLKGATVSIPKGGRWEELTLDYEHFAVIVEKHAAAGPFIEEFKKQENRIPCVKYKLWGIFKSDAARDLIALLTAIHRTAVHGKDANVQRTAALLTHFFNRPPETISPAEELTPCPDRYCSGDDLCAAHAFEEWGALADRQLWAQLFRSILERSGIRQRLIRLVDGERKLADLRQVTDYCVEYLYRQNPSLKELAEHLERLYNDEENAERDKNLHTLSTEKSSVKILTMHASKGLEFPVVFAMNSDEGRPLKGPDILRWTDSSGKKRFTPFLSVNDLRDEGGASGQIESYNTDRRRERRRLLYVAITRPQAMLFVPMRDKEVELSPHLMELLKRDDPNVALFDESEFYADNRQSGKSEPELAQPVVIKKIPPMSLREFITKETSYTQLKRESDTYGDDEKDDEGYVEDYVENTENAETESGKRQQLLTGGRLTGDALHRAIEEILNADDINAVINDAGRLDDIAGKYLKYGGVLDSLPIEEQTKAVKQASLYIKSAFRARYPIPNAGGVIVAGLPKSDRVPEMEFLLSSAPHRIRGFMDLVFRVKNAHASPHPYRYCVIDWKSDSLDSFDRASVEKYCIEKNYLLQAQIYSLALDRYLQGILGKRYDRKENLGGALYVFLRGFEPHNSNIENIWYRPADPQSDERGVTSALKAGGLRG